MKNAQKQMQKMELVMDMIKLINKMAQQGEDYSLIMRNYNELIDEFDLPLIEIGWISTTKFEFLGDSFNWFWED